MTKIYAASEDCLKLLPELLYAMNADQKSLPEVGKYKEYKAPLNASSLDILKSPRTLEMSVGGKAANKMTITPSAETSIKDLCSQTLQNHMVDSTNQHKPSEDKPDI